MTPRLRRSILFSLPGTLVPGIASYLALIAIKEADGATTLGYVSLALVVANLGAAIAALGPAHTALRVITADPPAADEVRTRFRGLVLRRSAMAAVAATVGAMVVLPLSSRLAVVLAVAAPWILGQGLVLFEAEALRAAHRYGQASALLAARSLVGWIAAACGAWLVGGVPATALPMAAVGLGCAAWLSGGRFGRISEDERRAEREIGRPVGHLSVASYLLGYGDRFVVHALLGPVAVATYTLGYQLGEGAMELVSAPVTSATMPRVVGLWQAGPTGPAEADALARRVGLGFLALGFVAPAAVLTIRPTGIFDAISRDTRLPGVVAITAAAVAVQGITRLGYGLLLAQGRTRTALANFLAIGVLSAIAAPLLTWRWGIIGTAWATLLGYGTLAAVTVRSARTMQHRTGLEEETA